MALQHLARSERTYLVECFETAGGPESLDCGFLATVAIADDEQLLVLVWGADAAAAELRCVAAGLTVDRVVEVTLSPAWRWSRAGPGARRRARSSPR